MMESRTSRVFLSGFEGIDSTLCEADSWPWHSLRFLLHRGYGNDVNPLPRAKVLERERVLFQCVTIPFSTKGASLV